MHVLVSGLQLSHQLAVLGELLAEDERTDRLSKGKEKLTRSSAHQTWSVTGQRAGKCFLPSELCEAETSCSRNRREKEVSSATVESASLQGLVSHSTECEETNPG